MNETTINSGKEAYKEYLRSDDWKKKREACFQLKGDQCWVCQGKTSIQVHHLHYRSWFDCFPRKDLIPLCKGCHKDIHTCISYGFIDQRVATIWILIDAIQRMHYALETKMPDQARFNRFRDMMIKHGYEVKNQIRKEQQKKPLSEIESLDQKRSFIKQASKWKYSTRKSKYASEQKRAAKWFCPPEQRVS
jgi:hypothetical protein